jgi:hypothetical protein
LPWYEVEEKCLSPRLSKYPTNRAWLPRDLPAGSVVRVFTVSVKYSGQPERDAGDYPTRQQAARAAALAAGIVGEHGAPPVKVGVHESGKHRDRVRDR